MSGELEGAAYELRRLVTAVLGHEPDRLLRPLGGGLLIAAAVVAAGLARRLW